MEFTGSRLRGSGENEGLGNSRVMAFYPWDCPRARCRSEGRVWGEEKAACMEVTNADWSGCRSRDSGQTRSDCSSCTALALGCWFSSCIRQSTSRRIQDLCLSMALRYLSIHGLQTRSDRQGGYTRRNSTRPSTREWQRGTRFAFGSRTRPND